MTKFYAKDKVIIHSKDGLKNGRIAGKKGDKYLIEPRGKNFQSLNNNAKMYWVDLNEVEIILHRRFKEEQNVIQMQSLSTCKRIICKN